jgi:hypothetical protein
MTSESLGGDPRPGSSPEPAIAVRRVSDEYLWLEGHEPGWRVVLHKVAYRGDDPLDVLTLESAAGDTRDLYFDLSLCGGLGMPPSRPCPYCGQELRTPRARQCVVCGVDFHDSSNVFYRKGRAHVERVRAQSDQRPESEAARLALSDPRAAFNARFQPRRVRDDVIILRVPVPVAAEDRRFFRIGLDLVAGDCRGFVCDLCQPSVGAHAPELEEPFGHAASLTEFWSRGRKVVLLHGADSVSALRETQYSWWPVSNYKTEAAAVDALTLLLAEKPSSDAPLPEFD